MHPYWVNAASDIDDMIDNLAGKASFLVSATQDPDGVTYNSTEWTTHHTVDGGTAWMEYLAPLAAAAGMPVIPRFIVGNWSWWAMDGYLDATYNIQNRGTAACRGTENWADLMLQKMQDEVISTIRDFFDNNAAEIVQYCAPMIDLDYIRLHDSTNACPDFSAETINDLVRNIKMELPAGWEMMGSYSSLDISNSRSWRDPVNLLVRDNAYRDVMMMNYTETIATRLTRRDAWSAEPYWATEKMRAIPGIGTDPTLGPEITLAFVEQCITDVLAEGYTDLMFFVYGDSANGPRMSDDMIALMPGARSSWMLVGHDVPV